MSLEAQWKKRVGSEENNRSGTRQQESPADDSDAHIEVPRWFFYSVLIVGLVVLGYLFMTMLMPSDRYNTSKTMISTQALLNATGQNNLPKKESAGSDMGEQDHSNERSTTGNSHSSRARHEALVQRKKRDEKLMGVFEPRPSMPPLPPRQSDSLFTYPTKERIDSSSIAKLTSSEQFSTTHSDLKPTKMPRDYCGKGELWYCIPHPKSARQPAVCYCIPQFRPSPLDEPFNGMLPSKDSCESNEDIPMWKVDEYRPHLSCARWQERNRNYTAKLYYTIMLGDELDMLEIVLYEIYPVVDYIIISEIELTHSLEKRKLVWQSIKNTRRFKKFTDKIIHVAFQKSKWQSEIESRDGWGIERIQRNNPISKSKLTYLGVQKGDIIIGNGDLDELPSRWTLMRWKYCQVEKYHLSIVPYRFNFGCMIQPLVDKYLSVVFEWEPQLKRTQLNLYARRAKKTQEAMPISIKGQFAMLEDQGGWHFNAFTPSIEALMRKALNSPHKFMHTLKKSGAQAAVDTCRNYFRKEDGKIMWHHRIASHPDLWPYFMQVNECYFQKSVKWIRKYNNSRPDDIDRATRLLPIRHTLSDGYGSL
eukprot:gene21262-1185_t